ncbi:uncharacterized protein EHS24_008646 [Apiotrichum porosum]|uniref:Uncharacterized protein n=1 Tax=Apiotrichum porosum TaxID=105984 RepID=A0A427XQS9_9TREE|nr:uncharacterized protein EHS24_008646 [Apiotrichum porosum]RSH81209.1 hypothetical protein EHS24_008646 [Apiotrichum porosum]
MKGRNTTRQLALDRGDVVCDVDESCNWYTAPGPQAQDAVKVHKHLHSGGCVFPACSHNPSVRTYGNENKDHEKKIHGGRRPTKCPVSDNCDISNLQGKTLADDRKAIRKHALRVHIECAQYGAVLAVQPMLEHQRTAHKVGHANVSKTINGCVHGCPYTSTVAIAAEEHNKKAHIPCGYMGAARTSSGGKFGEFERAVLRDVLGNGTTPATVSRIIKALSHRWETVDVVKSRIALDEHLRTMSKGGKMDLSHYKQ